jgi:hypothetical protein
MRLKNKAPGPKKASDTSVYRLKKASDTSVYRLKKVADTSVLNNEISLREIYKTTFLDIHATDFKELNYLDAQKACANLGTNWRLPTLNELESIFEIISHRKNYLSNNNNFEMYYYWTNTEYNKNNMWVLSPHEPNDYNKSTASKDFFGITNKFNTRAVNFSTFDVLIENPNLKFTFKEINDIVKEIGNGWRLPSSYELQMLSKDNNLPIQYGYYSTLTDPEPGYQTKYKLVMIRESR